MTNPLRDVRPEDRPLGLEYSDPRFRANHHQVNGNPSGHITSTISSRLRKTRGSSSRRRMHLAGDNPNSTSSSNNQPVPDYALTADLLAERTLDGLLAEHPGELIRTGFYWDLWNLLWDWFEMRFLLFQVVHMWSARSCPIIGDPTRLYPWRSKSSHLAKLVTGLSSQSELVMTKIAVRNFGTQRRWWRTRWPSSTTWGLSVEVVEVSFT